MFVSPCWRLFNMTQPWSGRKEELPGQRWAHTAPCCRQRRRQEMVSPLFKCPLHACPKDCWPPGIFLAAWNSNKWSNSNILKIFINCVILFKKLFYQKWTQFIAECCIVLDLCFGWGCTGGGVWYLAVWRWPKEILLMGGVIPTHKNISIVCTHPASCSSAGRAKAAST